MARLIQGFTCELQHFNEGDLSQIALTEYLTGHYAFYKILGKDCYFVEWAERLLVCGNLETVNLILEYNYNLFTYILPNSYIENAERGDHF